MGQNGKGFFRFAKFTWVIFYITQIGFRMELIGVQAKRHMNKGKCLSADWCVRRDDSEFHLPSGSNASLHQKYGGALTKTSSKPCQLQPARFCKCLQGNRTSVNIV